MEHNKSGKVKTIITLPGVISIHISINVVA